MPKKNKKQNKELTRKKIQTNSQSKNKPTPEQTPSTSSYLNYILLHQKNILLGILLITLLLPLALNNSSNNPLLTYSESYYHLLNSQEFNILTPNYIILYSIQKILPLNALILLPIMLSILNLFLLQKILQKLNFPQMFTFFFTLFLILSATMILHSSNITASVIFLFYTLLSFTLLTHEKKQLKYYTLIPLILASLLHPYFTIFLFGILTIYTILTHKNAKENTKFNITLIVITLILFILQITLLNQRLFTSTIQKSIQPLNLNFISDLGGESGISIFILFLAIIGLTITWKKTNYYLAYLTLPLMITFFFNTETILILTIIITFFATIGFIKLFETEWEIPTLKQFTLLILILGLAFSTLSYINRVNQIGPTNNDFNALTWINENTPSNTIILSDPKNSEFINYFAQRQTFISNNEIDQNKIQDYHKIIDAKYITDLFPLLEQNHITLIYLNQHTKTDPNYKYLIFLLKNERFKLVHSSEDTEVWIYTQNE